MPIFLMFGKYSSEALKGISPERTNRAVELIGKTVEGLYRCTLC